MSGLRKWFLLMAAALPLLAAACGGDGGNVLPASVPHVRAVTSLEVFADMLRQIGGQRVQVTTLLPPGADPHTFQLTPAAVKAISRADIVFINGLGLEATIGDVIRNTAGGDTPLVFLSENVVPLVPTGFQEERIVRNGEEITVLKPEREVGLLEVNPHLWLDVRYAMRYVERMRDALATIDPEGADVYRSNAQRFLAELEQLDNEIEEMVASIPPERRKLVIFHDSFPYFAQRYGFELVGVVIRSPGREPSAAEVAALVTAIRSEGVPAVFREPQFNARVLELAAKDAGLRVGVLYSDALGGDVASYTAMMRFNAQQLVEYLGP